MIFALAGNQNCGKTTLFNQLTGSNQHVGNFPGVTVDQKIGEIRGQKDCSVVDLPGIYSIRPYTSEEIVTRDFILNEKPDGIINIVDATNIERNLYLTLQLIEMNIPMVLALNMMDEMRNNGGTVDISRMSEELGIPVVPISAIKNEGIEELLQTALHVARNRQYPQIYDFCPVHRCIHSVCHQIEDHAEKAGISVRFAATKLIEGDPSIAEKLSLDQNELELIEHSIIQMEEEHGMDRNAALADMRYDFIEKVCAATVIKPQESKEHLRSVKIDSVLTNKYLAIPIFIVVMFLVFYLTFNVFGAFLSDLLAAGIDWVTAVVDKALTAYGINPVVHSLLIDGVFAGVGSVLSFLPIIVVLFFFLSILEDTGYMARVAFVMDQLLRRVGLSGRSFVPMLIGFGCSVPAIMATRTLSSDRDRKMTILLTPFMSCSAKLPIYALFTTAFFPRQWRAVVMVGLYLTGIVCGILYALVLKLTRYKGEPVPFVMELPAYHWPTLGNVLRSMWERGWSFIKKAGTIILLSTIAVWFTTYFGWAEDGFRMLSEEEIDCSILAHIGSLIAWIFAPLGWGNWKAAVASITGLVAKENIVGTLGILYGGGDETVYQALGAVFTQISGYSFLVFNLLCAPCFAAIGAIKREMNNAKWTWFAIGYQCGFAYLCALMVNQFGKAFTGSLNVIGLVAAIAALAFIIYMLVRPYKEATKLSTKV